MSMLRAQEYFAPLRSRHISLQQWERGQLFDTFGLQGSITAGGRLGRRQKSEGNLDQYMDAFPSPSISPPRARHAGSSEDHTHHPQRVRPVKKAIARSLSLSAATGTGRNHKGVGGSEIVDIKQLQANNNVGFRRNLSFSRSLTSSGEIALVQELEDLEEEPDHCFRGDGFDCTVSRTNSVEDLELSRSPIVDINRGSQKTPVARLLVSRSLNSSIECLGSELQEPDGSSSPRSVSWSSNSKARHPASSSRSWPRKFFSGGLLFSKEKRFYSGVLPLSKSSGRNTHGWASANGIPSSPLSKRTSCCSIQDGRLRRSNLFSRMLSFSRSLDSRGGFWGKNSNSYDESSSKDGLNRRFHGRRLSFSRSFDPSGELSPQDYDSRRVTDPFQSLDIDERTEFLGWRRGAGLSFSRSLDPGGEIVSDYEERFEFRDSYNRNHDRESDHERDGVASSRNSSSRSDLHVSSESTSVSSSSEATTSSGSEESPEAARKDTHKPPEELSWSKKLKVMTSKSGFFFSKSMESRKFRDASHHHQHASMSLLERNPTEPRPTRSKIFGRGFSLSFSRFLDPSSAEENASVAGQKESFKKESRFKSCFTKGLFAFTSSKANDTKHDNAASARGTERPIVINSSTFSTNKDSCKPSAAASRKLFFRDWSTTWSKGRSTSSSSQSAQLLSSTLASSAASSSAAPPQPITKTHDLSAPAAAVPKTGGATGFTASFPSWKNSRVLKYWWSKRGSGSSSIISGHSVTSKSSSDKQSKLVLLEKNPLTRQPEDDNLTVYVGERGGSLTKYILTKQILRHHLFQVLLKCSQDELGSDYDYKSGVPIICDPALFLQVARTVCSTFSSESESSR